MTKYYKYDDEYICVKKDKTTRFYLSRNNFYFTTNAIIPDEEKKERITKAEYLEALKILRKEIRNLL